MVEVADAVAQEDEPALRLYLLLHRGLKALNVPEPHPDVVTSFLLKAAAVVGVAPALDSCAACGREDDLRRFSFAEGGVLCESCRTSGSYSLKEGLTGYMADMALADLAELPPYDPAMSRDAMGVARRFLEYHLERRLESLAVLDV